MPSVEHDVVTRLFSERPQLAAELLQGVLHVPLPDYDYAGPGSGDLTEVVPRELRADAVVTFHRKRENADPEPLTWYGRRYHRRPGSTWRPI